MMTEFQMRQVTETLKLFLFDREVDYYTSGKKPKKTVLQAERDAARKMDNIFGGRDWRKTGMSATAYDSLRLAMLAPMWWLGHANQFGDMVDPKIWQQRSREGKMWAIQTAATGTGLAGLASLAMHGIAAGELTQVQVDAAIKDMVEMWEPGPHMGEIRDPLAPGGYYSPFMWQRDILKFPLAAIHYANGDPDKASETMGAYGKARLGVLPRAGDSLLRNKDWMNRDISSVGFNEDPIKYLADHSMQFVLDNQPTAFSEIEKLIPAASENLNRGKQSPHGAVINLAGFGRSRTITPLTESIARGNEQGLFKDAFTGEQVQVDAWSDLTPTQKRALIDAFPEANLTDYLRGYTDTDDVYHAVVDELAMQHDALDVMGMSGRDNNGDIFTIRDWRDGHAEIGISKDAAGKVQFANVDFDVSNFEEELLPDYYATFVENAAGLMDSSATEAADEAFIAKWGQQGIDFIYNWRMNGAKSDIARAGIALMTMAEGDGYFEMPRFDPGKPFVSGKTEQELMRDHGELHEAAVIDANLNPDKYIIQKTGELPGGKTLLKRYFYLHKDQFPDTGYQLDILRVAGDPDNPEYIEYRKNHPSIRMWLNGTETYPALLASLQRENLEHIIQPIVIP